MEILDMKDGDIYFENEVLKVTYKIKPTPFENDKNRFYTSMELDFLGHKSGFSPATKENAERCIKKRLKAYEAIPKGCIIIPKQEQDSLRGLLIGGILEDSIQIVYGVCEGGGLSGFSCSVHFLPSSDTLQELTNYKSLVNPFKRKGE